MHPRTPVLVGGGQITHTDGDAPPPVALLADAVRRAADDAGGRGVVDGIGSIRVVNTLSQRVDDPGRLVARELGLASTQTIRSASGGNMPQALVMRTAADILAGDVDVAVIGGVECWRTFLRHRRAGDPPPWTEEETGPPDEVFGAELAIASEHERSIGLVQPVHVYPLFETALRARLGRTPAEHETAVAALWAGFAAVAAGNPHAAIRRAPTAEEIASPDGGNRVISTPYRKLMNANNNVDQAAALIMCSVERARALGIPPERWVFLHGAASANETPFASNRADLSRCAPVGAAGRAALELAGVGVDDIAHVDVYSCFPSAVQIAAEELGLGLDRPLTVTGGLTFAGGPWNDYVTHSLATMLGVLRADPSAYGLVTANGGVLTKHAIGVYSCRPAPDGPRWVDAQQPFPTVDDEPGYRGAATIESYTVAHDRDDRPEVAFVALRTPDGARTMVRSSTAAAELEASDPIGVVVDVNQLSD